MDASQASSKPAAQKLVTIYLDNMAYAKGKMLVGSFGEKHGLVEEHLCDLLADNWRVAAVYGFAGNGESTSTRGWITVLLEKPNQV